jgi:general secretion pathway protein K
MNLHRTTSQRGIALIIVMISIFVLSMLAGGFAYTMKVETKLARNSNSEAELEWLGRSGVEYARWILVQQLSIPNEPYDALNQVWAGGSGGMGTSNSPLADVQSEVTLGNGSFTWKIVDLERKLNINLVTEPLLQQTLISMGADAGQLTPVINSILDWIDIDDNTRIDGAETDFYQSLEPPYYPKNGPIDDITELLFVAGITPELFWGESSTNYQPGAIQASLKPGVPSEVPAYPVGLVDIFTPLSSGKININTASAAVLQALPGIDQQVAAAIVSGREGEDDGSGLLGPYRSVQQVQRVPGVPMEMTRQLATFCDVRSKTFEVTIDAQVNGYKRRFVAILGRNPPRDIQILNFYWK